MGIDVDHEANGIVRVTVDNTPRRNALDVDMFRCLATLWPTLDADATVRCVILRGAGEQAFCSGADLSVDWSECDERDALIDQALLKTQQFSKPIIAAINGDCVAGGFELALSADLRAARAGARFGLPEVRWGIFPSGGAALKLSRQVPRALAMEMLLTGELSDAEVAHRSGFLNRVLPVADLDDWATATAQTICANSPVAVQAVKAFCVERDRDGSGLSELLKREQAFVDHVRESGQWREGVAAFLGKRVPDYLDR